jgi:hypothetical protein
MNESEIPSIAAAEEKAMDILELELLEPLTVASRVCDLIGRVLEKAVSSNVRLHQSKKVSMALLSRIANDLRCCILLAVRGYGAQACSIAASIYEESFTSLAVGANETLAQEWIDHSDPTRTLKSINELTDIGLIALAVKIPEVHGREYLKFRNLCLAKHSNPLYMKQRAYVRSSEGAVLKSGPDTSEVGIKDAWFALEHAAGFSFLATAGFLKHHIAAERELLAELGQIEDALISVNSRAVSRWGSEDPFRGKWKL